MRLVVVVAVQDQQKLRKKGRKRKSFGVKRASFASQSYAKKQRRHMHKTTPTKGVIVVGARTSKKDLRCLRIEQKAQAKIFLQHYPHCQSEDYKNGYLRTKPPTGSDSWWLELCRDKHFCHYSGCNSVIAHLLGESTHEKLSDNTSKLSDSGVQAKLAKRHKKKVGCLILTRF